MFRLKASPIFLHIAAWLLFLSLPLLFMQEVGTLTITTLIANLVFCSFYISIFYINAYWLIPGYYLKRRYVAYASCLLLLLCLVYILRPFDSLMNHARMNNSSIRPMQGPPPEPRQGAPHEGRRPPPPGEAGKLPPRGPNPFEMQRFDITSLFIFFMIIGLSTALQSMKQWAWYEKRAIIAEADKALYELSFLKAQINPHFLYNTLNNIYTLVITGSPHAGESIMKLSNIMRYLTDEAETDFVPLKSELECMSNFIELQKLRLSKTVSLDYLVSGDATEHQITPLILMTFIENAFKYGISNHRPAVISISITIEEGRIIFYSSNQVFEHKKSEERMGVGLINTRKRLEFLYPERHNLQILEESGYFQVKLILDTKPAKQITA